MSSVNVGHVTAVILAGGTGSRMCSGITKQRMKLLGISILRRSVLAFEKCDDITEIVVVARYDEAESVREELEDITKLCCVVTGGSTRAESARRGFSAVSRQSDYVAFHDAARPLVTPQMISEVVKAATKKKRSYSCGTCNRYC